MKILLVYPETPATFWSFKEALNIVSKKSAEPPLGLITVAAMLPEDWEIKLTDMNVSKLRDKDILWADYVFLSGMNVHINSFKEIVRLCNVIGTKVVAGGPMVTLQYKEFLGVDHFILNEAEITLPPFLEDLRNGTPKYIYSTNNFPDVEASPVPRWDLLDKKKYASMSIQYSRGCPYDCEFCSITMLNGHKPRTKGRQQFFNELNVLYNAGWRGGVSVVDDNFIGNKRKLKTEILPELISWQKKRKYPFNFITELSINLADDPDLMSLLSDAAFYNIFIGIETPNTDSLEECNKQMNLKSDLSESIIKLQKNGFLVSGGFIVGFDNDKPDIFEKQISFIQECGIPSAMIGLLNAMTGTKLYKRMKLENRLIENFSGNNTDGSINFIPKMSYNTLISGYSNIIKTLYSQKIYYERLRTFLANYTLPSWKSGAVSPSELKAFVKLLWKLGILEKGKIYFWKLLLTCLVKYPKKFSTAMTLAVYGFHFRRVAAGV
jgi:radical SAM superfamily enzyme YgiQ (UPF0313 family)